MLASQIPKTCRSGFSENRNASEERTDMDVVIESERDGFGFHFSAR